MTVEVRAQSRVERVEAIRRLYATRLDGLPVPVRRDHAPAGFVHRTVARVSCPDCFGELPGRRGCETCRGRGWLDVERRRDPYAVSKTVAYGLTGDRHEQARMRDAEIARLAAQTRAPFASPEDELADANEHPPAWWRTRERMYARFDYRALDVALERLRYALPDVAPMSVRGLAFLEPQMPDPIRAPDPEPVRPLPKGRMLTAATRQQRDRQVRKLLETMPPALVAQRTGLSPATVYAIIRAAETAA